MTPRRIGIIFTMPRPQMLQTTTMTIATSAMPQLLEQFSTADFERLRPMAMMIGPVTTGGKYFMTFEVPKARKAAASTR